MAATYTRTLRVAALSQIGGIYNACIQGNTALTAVGEKLSESTTWLNEVNYLLPDAGSDLTLTSTPSLDLGFKGQPLIIDQNLSSTGLITLQDHFTLTSSAFTLNAASIPIDRPRLFVYHFDSGAPNYYNWKQVGSYVYELAGYQTVNANAATTLTALAVCSGVVSRTGTSAAEVTDVMPTASNIVAQLGSGVNRNGYYWHRFRYINKLQHLVKFTANTGNTFDASMTGMTIAPGQFRDFVINVTAFNTTTWYAISNTANDTPATISAHAGGGQVLATPITKKLTVVSTVTTAADSVLMPSATGGGGSPYVVCNQGAQSMDVFPTSGQAFNKLAADTQIAVASGKNIVFHDIAAGVWAGVLSA